MNYAAGHMLASIYLSNQAPFILPPSFFFFLLNPPSLSPFFLFLLFLLPPFSVFIFLNPLVTQVYRSYGLFVLVKLHTSNGRKLHQSWVLWNNSFPYKKKHLVKKNQVYTIWSVKHQGFLNIDFFL